MRDRNTMPVAQYLVESVVWGFLSMAWYRNVLFRSMPGMENRHSQWLLWGMVLVCITIGVLLTVKGRRNSLSLFVNTIIPYEIYGVISYRKLLSTGHFVILILAVAVGLVFLGMVVYQAVTDRGKHSIAQFLRHGLLGSRTLVSLVAMLMFVQITVNFFLGNSLIKAKVPAGGVKPAHTVTLADNIETLTKLRQETWETLTYQERLDVLQVVANIECSYLGLPHKLTVGTRVLEEQTMAAYHDATQEVWINITHLEEASAHEMLDSVCHEAYHAYQHRLCDVWDDVDAEYQNLKLFSNVAEYVDNFTNYIRGEDDFEGYYGLACERTARQYAYDATVEYFDRIEEYLREEAQGG